MVKILLLFFLLPLSAHALFQRTGEDLLVAEDQIRYQVERAGNNALNWQPILVAPPQHLWEESKEDFAPQVINMLTRVFKDTAQLIPCAECRMNRTQIDHDGRLIVQNGELSLIELNRLKAMAAYREAKSVLTIQETPSGIQTRLISLEDGRILFQGIADSTQTLEGARPALHLAREIDRRKRGEALSYVFFNLGLYPKALVQLSWLEQWGSRNQFISGLTISGVTPNAGVGGTFLYMLPFHRKAGVSTSVFYLAEGIGSTEGPQTDMSKALVAELKLQYAIGSSYGAFVSVNTQGDYTAGLALFNTVLFPFLL